MSFRILLILGTLSAFGPMAIDFYLPSFPTLALVFGTDVEHVQLSLASYFAGTALGQLVYGPLADRYGRRWPGWCCSPWPRWPARWRRPWSG